MLVMWGDFLFTTATFSGRGSYDHLAIAQSDRSTYVQYDDHLFFQSGQNPLKRLYGLRETPLFYSVKKLHF